MSPDERTARADRWIQAEPGRSFGAEAEAYERGRPGWPAEAVDAVGLPPDATVSTSRPAPGS